MRTRGPYADRRIWWDLFLSHAHLAAINDMPNLDIILLPEEWACRFNYKLQDSIYT